jgi:hypothetical protein
MKKFLLIAVLGFLVGGCNSSQQVQQARALQYIAQHPKFLDSLAAQRFPVDPVRQGQLIVDSSRLPLYEAALFMDSIHIASLLTRQVVCKEQDTIYSSYPGPGLSERILDTTMRIFRSSSLKPVKQTDTLDDQKQRAQMANLKELNQNLTRDLATSQAQFNDKAKTSRTLLCICIALAFVLAVGIGLKIASFIKIL